MNIDEPNKEFDQWLGEWFFGESTWGCFMDNNFWMPTTSDTQGRIVLEKFIEKNPEWYVEIVYCTEGDFPWHVALRPRDGYNPEYTPAASGYPLPLLMCKVVILALTNGEIYDD